jgi:hypothetical protein
MAGKGHPHVGANPFAMRGLWANTFAPTPAYKWDIVCRKSPWYVTDQLPEPTMKSEFTAVIKQVSEGWIEEVPGVNCQEPTYEALLDSLRVTLQEAVEFNRQEALAAAGQGYREEPIVL